MEPVKIFISYLTEDVRPAKIFSQILKEIGRENLKILYRDDPYVGGEQRIRKYLNSTELFIYMLTYPSAKSRVNNYALFDIGYFASLADVDNNKRIVVLTPPGFNVPNPLKDYQSFEAYPDNIIEFLKSFAREHFGRDEPINPYLSSKEKEGDLLYLADKICSLYTPTHYGVRMHENSLMLKVEVKITKPILPKNTEVYIDAVSAKMFGLYKKNYIWEDIISSLNGDKTWVTELGEAIHSIVKGKYAKPIKGTFLSVEGKSFLPIIYRDEWLDDRFKLFSVLFVPTDVVPVDQKLVFVITAFQDDMEPVYEAIKEATGKYELLAKRVKDIVGDYRITDEIMKKIRQAKYIIADLTHERPNVYFELGYARGLNKTVITTLRKGTTVHFDVKDWTYIEYDDSRNLERSLIERFRKETQPELSDQES